MKAAFDEWDKKHDLYESDRPYAEDAFYGGMNYMLHFINANMPPEVSDAIGDILRANIIGDIK